MFATPGPLDFVAVARAMLQLWDREQVFSRLVAQNRGGPRFSFLDGPITANNPMGVHHAWGRTYKDVWQRYKAMQGFNQRWQNGFDCQGLWVEVEVEKSLNLKSKREIEKIGLDKFVRLCKERVLRMAALQTDQTVRLGNWMDWNDTDELRMLAAKLVENPNEVIALERNGQQVVGTVEQLIGQLGMAELGGSYFTFADENNYQIWAFLKECFKNGWLYRGGDVIPWCPRCATGISNMEMETDGYKDREDPAFTVRMRLKKWTVDSAAWSDEGRATFEATPNKYILAWTTTPWTLPANVMCSVGPKLTYAIVKQVHKDGEEAIYILSAQTLKQLRGDYEQLGTILGTGLEGWTYEGLFDDLPAWIDAEATWRDKHGFDEDRHYEHAIILWDDVGEAEGTGIVHNAPGCGPEDYHLGKTHGMPSVAPLDENGNYMDGYGPLSGQYGHDVPNLVEQLLRTKGLIYKREKYVHRYAHCWRCKTPLLYRQVDEWYISMNELRHQMMKVSDQINWVPGFGKEREMDWLRNMSDWMISKKRYWGLALPIWEYADGSFEVIGSYEELRARAVEGWDEFDGHTPHRPFIDAVKIKHPVTGLIGTRIPDVGNPWLDAGIVSFSTMGYRTDKDYWAKWFPADFITESFPGQFRNWFYSLIAMSTVLEETFPTKAILGFATLLDEKGEAMHKSKGNSIEFSEAADKAGADVMRWLYARQKYDDNLLFGYNNLSEVRRSVLIPLWNVYSFFVQYANADKWEVTSDERRVASDSSLVIRHSSLDQWVLARCKRP
ncbi:MAG: class I tRNA ligase family protein [Anaerolineae bacterium]|nr:class I tRNA ligase family protein [Anaerolineae bacterium]